MAEINEVVSKEAIKGIKDADAALIQFDGNVDKLIQSIKSFTAAMGGENTSLKDVNKAMSETARHAKALNDIQKQQTAVTNALQKAGSDRAAAMDKEIAKEKELTNAIKLQVKSIEDAQRQNKALTEVRKKLDLSTDQGRKTLQEYNAQMTKNTEFIRQNGTAMEKQRMNIGNYKSALAGIGSTIAGVFSVTAVLAFGRASFAAYEAQEKANRKLLASLNGNKIAFRELTDQANRLMLATGVPDEAINQIQMMGRAANLSMPQIKQLTEASVTLSVATGKDLDSSYQALIKSLTGQSKALKTLGPEFANLTAEQLKNGAAIDLVMKNYSRIASDAASDTDKMAASWGEFAESAGGALSHVVNPALQAMSGLINDINNKQGFWQKMTTLMGWAASGAIGTSISAGFDARNSRNAKPTTDYNGIRNAESTKEIINKAVATARATVATMDFSAAEEIAAKNAKEHTTALKLQVTALDEYIRTMNESYAKANELEQYNVPTGTKGMFNSNVSGMSGKGFQSGTIGYRASVGSGGAEANKGSGAMSPEEIRNLEIEGAQATSDAIFQIIRNKDQALLDGKLNDLEKEKNAKLSNAKLTQAQKDKIEADYAKKEAKLKTEAAKKEKAAAIIQSIISGVLAVMKAGGLTTPTGIAAAIAAAAQTGVIVAQPIPKFDAGTLNSPDTFWAGERRPEWMISPKGDVSLVTRPTLFTGARGTTIIGGAETERIMNAGGATSGGSVAPYIKGMTDEIVQAIKNKSELHISANGSKITERTGDYYKEYFNRKITWIK